MQPVVIGSGLETHMETFEPLPNGTRVQVIKTDEFAKIIEFVNTDDIGRPVYRIHSERTDLTYDMLQILFTVVTD